MANSGGVLQIMRKHKAILASINMQEGTEYQTLKPTQLQSLLAAMEGDVIAVLQTGKYNQHYIYHSPQHNHDMNYPITKYSS